MYVPGSEPATNVKLVSPGSHGTWPAGKLPVECATHADGVERGTVAVPPEALKNTMSVFPGFTRNRYSSIGTAAPPRFAPDGLITSVCPVLNVVPLTSIPAATSGTSAELRVPTNATTPP